MNGKFQIVFVAMGQGDCCLINCPDGRVVVVDCGSSSQGRLGLTTWFWEACVTLRDPSWCGGKNNEIAAVILTHPDKDHYNKLYDLTRKDTIPGFICPTSQKSILDTKVAQLSIDDIYISSAMSDDSPLGYYKETSLGSIIASNNIKVNKIHEITINNTGNSGKNRIKTWDKTSSLKASKAINSTTHDVISDINNDWSISVIAGNVPCGYDREDNSTEENANSLITLIKHGKIAALLTGDATFSTEKFLAKHHSKALGEVRLLQIPHHGSAYGSSPNLLCSVCPEHAVVSVEFLEHRYYFPRKSVIKSWERSIWGDIQDHDYDHWDSVDWEKAEKIVTSNGRSWFKHSESFYYLKTPAAGGMIAYYFNVNKAYGLYRDQCSKAITMTSQKTQIYEMDSHGVDYKG